MFKKRDSRGEDCVFAYGSYKHTPTHTHTHTHTYSSLQHRHREPFWCSCIYSLTHSLLNTHHMPSSIMGGRLRAPCLRELRALHRPCSMPFRCRFSCPFLPCWAPPTLFLNTLGSVMMTALTHLPWDGPAPSVTSSLLVFIQQSHTSHIWPK